MPRRPVRAATPPSVHPPRQAVLARQAPVLAVQPRQAQRPAGRICRSLRRLLGRRRCPAGCGGRLAVAFFGFWAEPPAQAARRPVLRPAVFSGHFRLDCLGRWLLGSCPLCRRRLFPGAAPGRARARVLPGAEGWQFGAGYSAGGASWREPRLFCRCGFLCLAALRAGCAILGRLCPSGHRSVRGSGEGWRSSNAALNGWAPCSG